MTRHRVLDTEGNLVNGAEPRLTLERTVEGLRWMMLSRAFDARATALQRQEAVERILAAPDMPVPADVSELRAELDELRGRRG